MFCMVTYSMYMQFEYVNIRDIFVSHVSHKKSHVDTNELHVDNFFLHAGAEVCHHTLILHKIDCNIILNSEFLQSYFIIYILLIYQFMHGL